MNPLLFTLDLREAPAHRLRVCLTLTLDDPVTGGGDAAGIDGSDPGDRDPNGMDPPVGTASGWDFYLPVWTPGSYLVREYARHVDLVAAKDPRSDAARPVARVAKNRWRVGGPPGEAEITYQVHAHDLSVRTNHADSGHAYWNGAPTFLWPVDREDAAASVRVVLPAGWDLAIALPEAERETLPDGSVMVHLNAPDHDTLVDSPGLAGPLTWREFHAADRAHRVAMLGAGPFDASDALVRDMASLVRSAARVFGQLPYRGYLFQILFTERGGGGLEHRDSTTVMAPRTWLAQGPKRADLLGLLAHEHFHVWNVKRMRPAEFWTYDYERENRTGLLWVAEGFTAYFDDLLCVRAGLVTGRDYLTKLAGTVQALLRNPGRSVQTLEQASEDAWLRLYRPDPNNVNTTQNYYGNGSVVAWLMDLAILAGSGGQRRLDDAMRQLYRDTYEAGRGYTFADVSNAISEAAGRDLGRELKGLVQGPLDPDFGLYLPPCGLQLRCEPGPEPTVGGELAPGTTRLERVRTGGPAHDAGLAPGDEILALDGLRTTEESWARTWQALARPNQPLEVLYARRGLIAETSLTPRHDPAAKVTIRLLEQATANAKALADRWLAVD